MGQKYTIISDPGVDDMIALLLLYKLSPTLVHTLISTFGNAPEEYTSRSAREFVAFLAQHWKYTHGATEPMKTLEHNWPTYFHGPDGVWNIHPNVSINAVRAKKEFSESDGVISLGPMTSTFSIFQQQKIRTTAIMGGAFNVKGNETKYAETNIAFDPDAAALFFERCQSIDVKLVPLDVTSKVFWTKEKVMNIPEDAGYKVWAKKLLTAWFDNYGDKRHANFELYDPLCVYSVFHHDHFEWATSGIRVIVDGKERGQTVLTESNPPCKIAMEVLDAQKIAERIFDLAFG